MGKQETEFLNGEGDAWFERNKAKFAPDPVIEVLNEEVLEEIDLHDMDILEIGSGRGRRLAILREDTVGRCIGIDPSEEAVDWCKHNLDSGYDDLPLEFRRATALSFRGYMPGFQCDLLIYGFCLYLCDRADISEIVGIGDQTLRNGGYLVIHDFDPEYPHKVPYHHKPGLFSYKMDYSKLWLANPAYSLVSKKVIDDGTAVWILRKDIENGWPLEDNQNRKA